MKNPELKRAIKTLATMDESPEEINAWLDRLLIIFLMLENDFPQPEPEERSDAWCVVESLKNVVKALK